MGRREGRPVGVRKTGARETGPRFTAAELQRSSFDRVVAAEIETARLRREVEYLQGRVDQLERREDQLMALLKETAART